MNNSEFFNSLDYVYIVLMFFSTAMGFVRGFVKDFFSTCAWFGSGFIAILAAPYLTPAMSERISNITLARCAAIGISYIIILVILLLIISSISQKVRAGLFSGIDRAVGVLFGLFRGLGILVCLCILMLVFEIPRDKYPIVKNSKLSTTLFCIAEYFMPKIAQWGLGSPSQPIIVEKRPPSISREIAKIKIEKINKKEKSHDTERVSPGKIETRPEQKQNMSMIFQKIRSFFLDIISQKEKEISSEKIPTVVVTTANKPKYGSMSLMEARAKRRAKRKMEKLKKEVQKRLDRKSL